MKSSGKRVRFSTEPDASYDGDWVFFNIDVDNCFLSLLHNELGKTKDTQNEYPMPVALDVHCKKIRALLAEYLSITAKEAKQDIIRILHLGKPKHELPCLWNLALDVHHATRELLNLDQFQHLRDMFNSRPNPLATKLHYALASIEDSIFIYMEQACL